MKIDFLKHYHILKAELHNIMDGAKKNLCASNSIWVIEKVT